MNRLKLLALLVTLLLIIVPIKEGQTHLNTDYSCEYLTTIDNSLKPDYTIIDTLGFNLEKEDDFINAFDRLAENQFLVSDVDKSGKEYLLIAEGIFPKEELKYYCSYKDSNLKESSDMMLCLRSSMELYKTYRNRGACLYILKKEKSIGIYNLQCAKE